MCGEPEIANEVAGYQRGNRAMPTPPAVAGRFVIAH